MIRLLLPMLACAATLEERVQKLEIEVAALRAELGKRETGTVPAAGGASCELRTPFDGIFRASGPNAAAEVLAACRAKTKSELYCREKAVACGDEAPKR